MLYQRRPQGLAEDQDSGDQRHETAERTIENTLVQREVESSSNISIQNLLILNENYLNSEQDFFKNFQNKNNETLNFIYSSNYELKDTF